MIADRVAIRDAVLLAAVAFASAVLVHLVVLRGFANSGDEYAYLWQATAFANGAVTARTPEPPDAFRLNHIGDVGGRRFSKYPPGWPLLLAPGVAAGTPGLVNPLIAALALGGIYLFGRWWIGRRAALLGAIFTLTTPFFLLNAASFHSHPACLLAITLFALALASCHGRAEARVGTMILAGAAFGLAVLIRPYTALLLGVPLLAGFRRVFLAPRAVRVAAFAAGGLPFALFLLVVNRAVTGSWLTLAWTYYDAEERVGFGVHGHTLWRGLKTTVRLLAEGVLYTGLLSPLILAAAASAGGLFRRNGLMWVLLCAPIVGYVFWWSHGGNRYGPRFYFEALLPFTVLAGIGLERLLSARRSVVIAVAGLQCAVLVMIAMSVHRTIVERESVYRLVAGVHPGKAIVLLTTASGDMSRTDLTRNPPDYTNSDILYAISRGEMDSETLGRYPDRAAYYYRYEPGGGAVWRAR